MRIGIDANEANVVQRVGSNQYAYHVLIELEKLTKKNDEVVVLLAQPPVEDLPKPRKGWSYQVVRPTKFWSQIGLPLELARRAVFGQSFHVVLSLGHYAPRVSPFPSVICIMDLAFLKFPHFFKKSDTLKLTDWTAYSAKQAAHIIAISQHTKRDVMAYYQKKDHEVTVAYPGLDHHPIKDFVSRAKDSERLQALGITQPYLVYIGTLQPRKNIVRLVHAFEQIVKRKEYRDLVLVVGGKVGWLADEVVKTVQNSEAKANIRMLGFVSDEDKNVLYRHAKAALLVGLYEGFGIPPLEAMEQGTIPVVAHTASLPEVVGKAGVLVDPYNSKDIARGILEVLDYSPAGRASMRAEAKKQLKKFSWQEAGEIVYNVLKQEGRT